MGSEDRQGQAWWSGSSGSSGWAGELCSGCKYTKRRGPACTDSAQGLGETLLRTVHFPARPSVWLAAESGRSGHGRFSCRQAWQRNCFNGTRRADGRTGGQAGRRVGASRATRRMTTTATRAGAVTGSKGQRRVQRWAARRRGRAQRAWQASINADGRPSGLSWRGRPSEHAGTTSTQAAWHARRRRKQPAIILDLG
jgi:hypothetical protein